MTKVALYARYSSENQKDSSIDQQMRLLMQRVEAEGWEIAGVYQDKALSGSNMMRPGVQALLSAALDKQFDIVLTESIDRLSRDQEDIAHMHKRFRHRGIAIITLIEGEITELHIGLKGTMSALYLKDLSRRVHRGIKELAIKGESSGGKSYGYDIVPRYDAKGDRMSGERRINEEQAAIVRHIFEEYTKGKSPKKIAAQLNAEGIPAQGGREWAASTIYGNRRRGTGILNNELYIGTQIWGKQSFFKDPDTVAKPDA
jgi:site-specific DNA recombinase